MIYLDNAATTPVMPEVANEVCDYLKDNYYNPSALYGSAQRVRKDIEDVRQLIADSLGADKNEIFFTSGGTESDNWALKSVAEYCRNNRAWGSGHIITTTIEHHAILHTCKNMEQHGFSVTYVPADDCGFVNPKDIEAAIRPDTILISVMYANNEIGTIEPICEIGEIAYEHRILFHTDAVQAYGHKDINVKDEKIDMLSASGHKFGAPKGVGFLYMRSGLPLQPFIHGGEQEDGMRAGTENTPGIIGMGTAVKLTRTKEYRQMEDNVEELRDYFCERVLGGIPYVHLNGSPLDNRLQNNLNFRFDFIEGESLLILLDAKGICASSGSACTALSDEPSHVLKAIGLTDEQAHNSIRFTLGIENTKEEIDYTVKVLQDCVEQLRDVSPEYNKFKQGVTE